MDLRARTRRSAERPGKHCFTLALGLSEIHDQCPYIDWGHSTFFDYTTNELDITKRMSRVLVHIGANLRAMGDVEQVRFKALPWAELKAQLG